MFEILGGMIVLTIMILLSGLKVVKEYDRLVIFRLGKVLDPKGPGLHLVIPVIDRAQIVDSRMTTIQIQMLEDYTHDQYNVKVSATLMIRVVDAKKAIVKVDDAKKSIGEIAQASLRNLIRQHNLIHLVFDRRRLGVSLKAHVQKQSRDWGVQVHSFEIKEVKIPRETRRVIAQLRQHESDRGSQHDSIDESDYALHHQPVGKSVRLIEKSPPLSRSRQ